MDSNTQLAIQLMQYISARPDYETWIKTIAAVGNTFDTETALSILLSRFTDETPNEHRRKLSTRLKDVNFGTLVLLARENGYSGPVKGLNHNWTAAPKPIVNNERKNVSISYDTTEIRFRFLDDADEERAGIYEYDAGLTRYEAEKRVIADNPGAGKQRLFHVSVNRHVINKNVNPHTGEPYKDYSVLTKRFTPALLTVAELIDTVGRGFPVICGTINGNRCKGNWTGGDVLAVDVDDGLTIEAAIGRPEIKSAMFLYTSYSHTAENNRFRIVFPLPGYIQDSKQYEDIAGYYIGTFHADTSCRECSRAYYGNTNATVYDFTTGSVLNFRDGVLYE